MQKIQKGDRQAFDKLFLAFYKPLCGYAFSFLNNWEEAEEIVQTVFMKLWEGKNLVHTSIKSYLYSSTHNACINQIKHYKVKDKYMDYVLKQGENHDSSDYLISKELEHAIESSISSLPEQRRRIFKMSRFKGLKYAEIAAALNISVKTVEVQMGKALRSLREDLKEFLPIIAMMLTSM